MKQKVKGKKSGRGCCFPNFCSSKTCVNMSIQYLDLYCPGDGLYRTLLGGWSSRKRKGTLWPEGKYLRMIVSVLWNIYIWTRKCNIPFQNFAIKLRFRFLYKNKTLCVSNFRHSFENSYIVQTICLSSGAIHILQDTVMIQLWGGGQPFYRTATAGDQTLKLMSRSGS